MKYTPHHRTQFLRIHWLVIVCLIVLGVVLGGLLFVSALNHNVGGFIEKQPQEPNTWLEENK